MYYLILTSATNKETESQKEKEELTHYHADGKWQSRNSNLGLSDSKIHTLV